MHPLLLTVLLLLSSALCGAQEVCTNRVDDDGDGFIDCYDDECAHVVGCESVFYGYPVNHCQIEPPVGQFALTELWRSTTQVSTRSNAFVADMDADGMPEVIVHSLGANQLYIMNGQTGATLTTITCPAISDYGTSIAVGDTDDDGFGEVYAVDNNGMLRCFEHNGPAKAGFVPANCGNFEASPGIADFNGDGMPEIFIGNRIFHSQTGALIASGGAGSTGQQPGTAAWHSVAADVLPTGACANCGGLELVCGNTAYAVNIGSGTVTAQAVVAGRNDGYTSIADMNMDGSLDVVVTSNGTIYVWNPATALQLGNVFNIPNTSTGGRANIADYDNDGQPEIGVAGDSRYVVIDFNTGTNALSQLWIRTTVDGSQQTGGSAFDFEGDGATEVVYRDENVLYVYDGATGATKSSVPCGSGTRTEFPTVADVNADGQADIVCNCANANQGSTGFVRLYSSTGSRWIATRKVMNQHAYSITNINDDLSIPVPQQNNAVHPAINSFLSQSPLFDADWNPLFIPVADLTITVDTVISCVTVNQLDVTVTVCNSGSADVDTDIPLTFYSGDPLAGGAVLGVRTFTSVPVDTGTCATMTFALPWAGGDVGLNAFVNDDGSSPATAPELLHDECDSTNNRDVFAFVAPDFEPTITGLLTDHCLVNSNYPMTGTPTGGTFSGTGVAGSNFNPQNASIGQHSITYIYMFGVCPFDTLYQTTVRPPIVVDAGRDTAFCAGETVTIGTAAMPGYTYLWTPTMGVTDVDAAQSDLTLMQVGTFQYTLTADSSGCAGQGDMTVTVYPLPDASFTATDVCLGETTVFTDGSTVGSGSIVSYTWEMGDAQTYAIADLQHPYGAADNYSVTLIVETDEGCRDTVVSDVEVYDNPVAEFTVENICLGETALFENESTIASGQIATWDWDFGDGETLLAQNGNDMGHEYLTADDHTATLVATSDHGCSDTVMHTVTVSPVPDVDFSATEACLNETTLFTDLTTVTTGTVTTWTWAIDGTSVTGDPAPQYTYTTDGTFSVTLTVETDSGCGGSATGDVTVHPLPEPSFTAEAVCEGVSTAFVNSTTISSGSVVSQQWDFGDQTSASQTDPDHLYAVAGIYPTTLTATSHEGCTDAVTEDVEVYPLPVAVFDVSAPAGCEPHETVLTDQSTIATGYSIASWIWGLGDGSVGQGAVQNHTYSDAGSYDVLLTVISANGCTTTVTQNDAVTVYPLPEAAFTATPQPTDMFYPHITFTDFSEVSAGDITQWQWTFGDGSDTLEMSPVHTYADVGTYPVTLTITTDMGCTDFVRDDVIIRPVFTIYVPDAFTPNADGMNDVFAAYGEGISDFEMHIFNRWGERIFSSYSVGLGWNGSKFNTDEQVQQGIYTYIITLSSILSSDVYQYKGKVNLLR